MALFFTSDTHFGHGNIIKYCNRPGLTEREQEQLLAGERFKVCLDSVQRMNAYLLDEINNLVGPDDTLWHLGDFCFGHGKSESYKTAKAFRDRIACRNVHLIWGNHDNYSIAPLFSSTHKMETVFYEGQQIVCCHYAMAIWNKSHHGAWHLYGHSHAGAEEWLDKALPGRRSFDVGVDNAARILGAYRPWSFEEIQTIMKKRQGSVIDHHGDE